jgi:hypothetical protein
MLRPGSAGSLAWAKTAAERIVTGFAVHLVVRERTVLGRSGWGIAGWCGGRLDGRSRGDPRADLWSGRAQHSKEVSEFLREPSDPDLNPADGIGVGWLRLLAYRFRFRGFAAARYGGRPGGRARGTPTASRPALAKLWSRAQTLCQLRNVLLQRFEPLLNLGQAVSVSGTTTPATALVVHRQLLTPCPSPACDSLIAARTAPRNRRPRSGLSVGRESPTCETSYRDSLATDVAT